MSLFGVVDRLKSVPVPFRPTTCGLLKALSLIDSAPCSEPVDFGANVMLMVQVDVALKLAGQLLVCVKFPTSWTLVMFSAALPEFVSVTT